MEGISSRRIWSLVILLAPFAVAAAGGALTRPEIPGWYAHLAKSALNPPARVFAPVWTALFALMGYAGFLVARRAEPGRARIPVVLFALQLVFNLGWSFVFFHLHSPGWALAEIAVLWALILATLVSFWRVLPLAGVLLIPYLGWVSFAAVLNLAVWRLN